jgi:hypothetical protein
MAKMQGSRSPKNLKKNSLIVANKISVQFKKRFETRSQISYFAPIFYDFFRKIKKFSLHLLNIQEE